MIFAQTSIRETSGKGKGLFMDSCARKGDIIGILSLNASVMTEDEYLKEVSNGNTVVIATGVRFIGGLFLYKNVIEDEEYINHSEYPTMLYHCGMCFATKDLIPGDELTVNYKYFLPKRSEPYFTDSDTGHEVNGLDSREALAQSTIEFARILSEI